MALNEPKYALEPADYRCAECASEVAVAAPFFSAVHFEGEAFRRRSYCSPCWDRPPGGREGAYAFWRSRRPSPEAPARRLRFDPQLVLEFFRRLDPAAAPAGSAAPEPAPGGGAGSPEAVRLRLVLALLLVRRKILVFQSAAAREGTEYLKLTEKADPSRTHLVENPPLGDAELETVRSSLANLLQMDL